MLSPYKSSSPAPTRRAKKVVHTELNRRNNGGIRKARGRIEVDIRLEKNGSTSSVVIDLKNAANLQPDTDSESNHRIICPYARIFLTNEKSGRKPIKPKQTATHKHDADPKFDEGYSWTLQMGKTTNLSKSFAVIQVWDDTGRLRRAKFLGGMAFSLEQVLTGDAIDGWYKLLSAPKANTQNIPWHPGLERAASFESTGASSNQGGGGGGSQFIPGHPSLRPLPSLPIESALGGSGSGSRLSMMCLANGTTQEDFARAAETDAAGTAAANAAKIALVARAEAHSAASVAANQEKRALLVSAVGKHMPVPIPDDEDANAYARSSDDETDVVKEDAAEAENPQTAGPLATKPPPLPAKLAAATKKAPAIEADRKSVV